MTPKAQPAWFATISSLGALAVFARILAQR
jgi:hypothetical protein